MHKRTLVVCAFFVSSWMARAQGPASVSQVVMWSTVTNQNIAPGGPFTPSATGTLPSGLLSVYGDTLTGDRIDLSGANTINNPLHYSVLSPAALSSALSSNIAVALSIIPVESPTSGVILKTDPTTGASLPVADTLGPIFTERAETIGKGRFYIGITHQDYHFTSFNGMSLNGLSVLYPGGNTNDFLGTKTPPATFNLALDVRLSQNIAFLTYGVTNRFDVSLGLPMVHAAVASSAYNGAIYAGSGTSTTGGNNCWCVSTFTPGSFDLTAPFIGSANLSKTGFGDVVLRFKGTVLERPGAVLALGSDLRFPTGDAANYLGTGTTSVKPFLALSLYSKPLKNGIVFAPHADVGWQFSGKSILGGMLSGSPQTATLSDGSQVSYPGPPFTTTKGYLPDVFTWAVGTEVALGSRNTLIADVLGDQIGWVHGLQTLQSQSVTGLAPAGAQAISSGLAASSTLGSFGQYSGAFGYKARLPGNLIFTFQALVRLDNNGLTARFVPLFGLGYGFGPTR